MKIPTAAQRRAPCEFDIASFRRGAFSIRDGWAAGSDPGWYRAAARRELERRIGAKKIQVGSVLIAASDTRGRERCRQDCASDYSGPVTLARKRKNRRNDYGEKWKRRTVARQVGKAKVKHAAYRRCGLAACSKWLFEWPQIEFVGPSASGLTMQRPIGVGDSVDGKQAVLPLG